MSRTRKAWSDEDVALLSALASEGVGLPMIALRLERTKLAVLNYSKSMKIKVRPR